jgi:prepilin-type N-terminal cleavage/methylation domain-containing protein
MRKMSSRRGFTLPEVLVTVTIVAVLAAVMVPAVLNQVGKGDVPSVAGDLPSASKDFFHNAYGNDTTLYRGPYLPTTPGAHTGPTGGVYADSLVTIASSNFICVRDDSVSDHSKVSLAVAKQIDLALDGSADPAAGVVRYTAIGTDSLSAGTLRACVTTH